MSPDPEPHESQQAASGSPSTEPVWTFRGYKLRASEFTTAMAHLFRAEISRANVWRQRLDTTTNWAVVTTGAVITFAFSSQLPGSHSMIILNTLLVTLFLFIETRRYRYYELWSFRVRLMETDFFAAMLVPPFSPAADWAESLAETLLQPAFPISTLEALGRRLRRNYVWIFLLLALVWLLKIWMTPAPAASWDEMLSRAAIGGIPGTVVLALGVVYNSALILTALLTRTLHRATGEVLPRYEEHPRLAESLLASTNGGQRPAWFRQSRRRQQFMTLIITDQSEAVAGLIMQQMRRGVTRLDAVGMYTHREHALLLCALTATEVPQLKALVSQADPRGFVIVVPAQDVLGQGFQPLPPNQRRMQ
jgi:uncharacterized membrane protein